MLLAIFLDQGRLFCCRRRKAGPRSVSSCSRRRAYALAILASLLRWVARLRSAAAEQRIAHLQTSQLIRRALQHQQIRSETNPSAKSYKDIKRASERAADFSREQSWQAGNHRGSAELLPQLHQSRRGAVLGLHLLGARKETVEPTTRRSGGSQSPWSNRRSGLFRHW